MFARISWEVGSRAKRCICHILLSPLDAQPPLISMAEQLSGWPTCSFENTPLRDIRKGAGRVKFKIKVTQ